MRVERSNRTGKSVRSGGAGQRSGGASFTPEMGGSAKAASTAPVAASTGIDTILALQGIDDPLFARRKAIKKGHSILDTLEEVKADLIMGRVGEGRLNRLLALVQQAREQLDPDLEELIEEIELRALVELAKLGRFVS